MTIIDAGDRSVTWTMFIQKHFRNLGAERAVVVGGSNAQPSLSDSIRQNLFKVIRCPLEV